MKPAVSVLLRTQKHAIKWAQRAAVDREGEQETGEGWGRLSPHGSTLTTAAIEKPPNRPDRIQNLDPHCSSSASLYPPVSVCCLKF